MYEYLHCSSYIRNKKGVKTIKFSVQFPKKLQFEGSRMANPNSWATFGDHKQQSMTICQKNGCVKQLKILRGNYQNAKQLKAGMHFWNNLWTWVSTRLWWIANRWRKSPKKIRTRFLYFRKSSHRAREVYKIRSLKVWLKDNNKSSNYHQVCSLRQDKSSWAVNYLGRAATFLAVYALLQDYLIQYYTEVGLKSANLHDQLKTHADKLNIL
jgi:hypothetical protein